MVSELNNAQLEILNLFSTDLSEKEIGVLRSMLIEFRYWRLQNALDPLNITPETLEKWSSEHLRTPYKSQKSKMATS
jgi:hypothetical protein